ncbi:MAG: CRISPR-associated helicase Cas3' [Candidatus Brocadiia bacterium]
MSTRKGRSTALRGKPSGFWGKLRTNEEGQVVQWHPLAAHCADVGAVTEALVERTLVGRRLAHLLDVPSLSRAWRARLCVLSCLHDVGKVNHGFQNRAQPGTRPRAGHVRPFADAIHADQPLKRQIVRALGLAEMAAWFQSESQLASLLLAAVCHHGRPLKPGYRFRRELWEANQGRDPISEMGRLREKIGTWFPRSGAASSEPLPAQASFEHAFNGLVNLADWIASDEEMFPYAEDDSDRMPFARERARDAISRLGLDASAARRALGPTEPDFSYVSEECMPRPVQRRAGALPKDAEGSITILESATGSGKTEAALVRFVQLFHGGLVDGMYFALPTRAAATQLHRRVRKAVARAFPEDESRPAVVLAVPGYVRVDEVEGKLLPEFRVLWDDNDRERWHYRGWAASNPKRYLAAPVAVGTIDQVLLSTLQARHAHLRATSLLRHLLVVDEVHASDPYMGGLLEEVLRHHLAAGGHAFLMSATLGAAAQTRLLGRARADRVGLEEARALPYPLVTHRGAAGGAARQIEAEPCGYEKTVTMKARAIAGAPTEIASVALKAASEGARVLVIRNTVRDCVATQVALERLAGPEHPALFRGGGVVAPHHSRYAAPDRKLLDRAMEAAFGKGSKTNGVVAVATQTVEQSLDIDADLMLSDLCPADVLLQRIGRLHRHPEERPPEARPREFRRPRCDVLVPEQRALEPYISTDGHACGPHGLGTVYEDLRVLEATWRLLEQHDEWIIPAMNREIVEHATHPDALSKLVAELGGRWPEHANWVLGIRSASRVQANIILLPRDRPFGQEGFPSDPDCRILTRLGHDDRRVELEEPVAGPFGQRLHELTLPHHYAPDAPEDAAAEDVTAEAGTLRFAFGGRRFIYDRLGLHPADADYRKECADG